MVRGARLWATLVGTPMGVVGIGAALAVVVGLTTGRYPWIVAPVLSLTSLVGACGHVLTLCPSSLQREHGIFPVVATSPVDGRAARHRQPMRIVKSEQGWSVPVRTHTARGPKQRGHRSAVWAAKPLAYPIVNKEAVQAKGQLPRGCLAVYPVSDWQCKMA